VATVAASTGAVTITGAGDATITAADSSSQKSYSLVVAKAAQLVTVSGTATVDAVVGASWSVSIATNVGPGALSFSSDAATTVRVDAVTGALQVLAPGSAKISIVKVGDANHAAAQASFTVNAVAPMIQALNVWVGSADSLVTASPAAPSLNFYRSTSSSCVLANYSTCPNGQFDLLAGSVITDTALNLTSTAYYWLEQGSRISPSTQIEIGRFSARQVPGLAAFNGRLFLVGGYDGQLRNDVWSSADGKNWTQVTPAAAFSPRRSFCMAVYNGQLWLIGGYDGTNVLNDIWVSSDGITWTQKPLSAGFSARESASLIAFQNRLWLIGGSDVVSDRNDVGRRLTA